MARLAADSKMGFYPTPDHSLDCIVDWISREYARRGQDKVVHVIDPCCGEGAALSTVCQESNLYPFRSWGIELDVERAQQASFCIQNVINVSIFDARVNPLESCGLLWLNPPYDHSLNGKREEMNFLKHSIKWLCPGGVLVFIVPEFVAIDNPAWISQHFESIKIFRLHKADFPSYKQVVLFGIKRPLRVEEGSFPQAPYEYIDDVRCHAPYIVPPTDGPSVFQGNENITDEEVLKNRGKMESFINQSIKNLKRGEIKTLSPILPLRKGHLVSLLTAGGLNGKIQTEDGGFIVVKGFGDRVTTTREEENAQITRDTYAVGIRVIESTGWYDIR